MSDTAAQARDYRIFRTATSTLRSTWRFAQGMTLRNLRVALFQDVVGAACNGFDTVSFADCSQTRQHAVEHAFDVREVHWTVWGSTPEQRRDLVLHTVWGWVFYSTTGARAARSPGMGLADVVLPGTLDEDYARGLFLRFDADAPDVYRTVQALPTPIALPEGTDFAVEVTLSERAPVYAEQDLFIRCTLVGEQQRALHVP